MVAIERGHEQTGMGMVCVMGFTVEGWASRLRRCSPVGRWPSRCRPGPPRQDGHSENGSGGRPGWGSALVAVCDVHDDASVDEVVLVTGRVLEGRRSEPIDVAKAACASLVEQREGVRGEDLAVDTGERKAVAYVLDRGGTPA